MANKDSSRLTTSWVFELFKINIILDIQCPYGYLLVLNQWLTFSKAGFCGKSVFVLL